MADFSDHTGHSGVNAPGTSRKIYFFLLSDLTANGWPGFTSNPTTLAEEVSMPTDFAFLTGKKMYSLTVEDKAEGLKISDPGEKGSGSFDYQYDGFIRGLGAVELGLVKKFIQSPDLIFLIPDKSGVMHCLGNEQEACHAKIGEGGSGQSGGDRRGLPFIVTVNNSEPQVYTGNLVLTPAA